MRSLAVLAATLAVASAQTWYGIAPDDTLPGLINLFIMDARGQPIAPVAAVVTTDQEYPKAGTLRCLWTTDACYFATGTGRPYVQDYVYAVNRTSGAVIFKHAAPFGVYIDNLVLDWATDVLYSVSFDLLLLQAFIVTHDGKTGNVTILGDISKDLAGGVIYPGSVTMCPGTTTLYVGVDAGGVDGSKPDFILGYSLAGAPKLNGALPLLTPISSSLYSFCNATNLVALSGNYIQSDNINRETLVVGDYARAGNAGLVVPFATGALPTFTTRGEISLFPAGIVSEFAGTFLIPVFPQITPGPGPAPPVVGGLLFTWTYTGLPFRTPGLLTPIGYFLAGAAGVPGR